MAKIVNIYYGQNKGLRREMHDMSPTWRQRKVEQLYIYIKSKCHCGHNILFDTVILLDTLMC